MSYSPNIPACWEFPCQNSQMKKLLSLALIPFLILGIFVTPVNAVSSKADSTCPTDGQNIVYSGRKFSCAKSVLYKVAITKNTTLKKQQIVAKFFVPHPVVGNYGITWENVVSRVNDISAAAWTDAQASMLRNKRLPNAFSGYKSYISPGALSADPDIGEVETLLKRTFALFARIPAPKNIIFVATTKEERTATKGQIDRLYSKNSWIKVSLDSIYGIGTDQPKESAFTQTQCNGRDQARNTSTYPNARIATALIVSVCPDIGTSQTHFEGTHVMAHEYLHSIQAAVLINVLNREKFEPCWLREGAAEWTQSAVSKNFDEYLSSKHLEPYLLTSNGLQFENTTARTWTAEEVDTYLENANKPSTCGLTNKFALAYSLGEVATETLVSIGGSESFFALQLRLAKGQSSNQAFKAVYGKSWDEARPILAKVIAQKITLSWSQQALTYQTRPID